MEDVDDSRAQTSAAGGANLESQRESSALVPVVEGVKDGEAFETSKTIRTPFTRLPVDLLVAVPVRDFRVRNLLGMEPGSIYETQWGNGEDLPLNAGEVQIAWVEFEVVDTRLAVRVTRLA